MRVIEAFFRKPFDFRGIAHRMRALLPVRACERFKPVNLRPSDGRGSMGLAVCGSIEEPRRELNMVPRIANNPLFSRE